MSNENEVQQLYLGSEPLPLDAQNVSMDIYSEDVQLGSSQGKILEGKITFNPQRCQIFFVPPYDLADEYLTHLVNREQYDLYLLIIPFNLHNTTENKYYRRIQFILEFTDPDCIAFELFPANMKEEIERSQEYILSPFLKFQSVEPNVQKLGSRLYFDIMRPVITINGIGEKRCYWTYQGTSTEPAIVPETKYAVSLLAVPKNLTTLSAKISYEALLTKKTIFKWTIKEGHVVAHDAHWILNRTHCFSITDTFLKSTRDIVDEQAVDVCVVCALAEEAEAFIHMVEYMCAVQFRQAFDSRRLEYRTATISNHQGEALCLHVSWLPNNGLIETSLYISTFLKEFTPRLAVMTGICAGDPKDVALGDLVVADRTFVYDEGKFKLDADGHLEYLPDLHISQLSSEVLRSVRMFSRWKENVPRAVEHFSLPAVPALQCHIAAMASGNSVRSDNPFPALQQLVRKTQALDMEGAAFYRSVNDFPGIRSLLVKGISDFANSSKDDSFHTTAELLSALYALSYIQEYVTSSRMPRLVKEAAG